MGQMRNTENEEPDFIAFRRSLHQHPELSGHEKETRNSVLEFLNPTLPNKIVTLRDSMGLLLFYGKPEEGSQIMVRCELDALPIQETNSFAYRSQKEGVSHKCGHDGHMAILSRLAFLLSKNRPQNGCVTLLFQPAEENGMGAKAVFEELSFQKLAFDLVIALHNVPGYEEKSILIRKGAFTPAVCSLIIRFKGKTSHAAEPENGFNPAEAMAKYILKALSLNNPDVDDKNFLLITPVYQMLGDKSYGVSAGYGEVHLTIRSWRNDLLSETLAHLCDTADQIGADYHLQIENEQLQEFRANQNDAEVVKLIARAAENLQLKTQILSEPMKWGEDFGLFTEHFKGAMFGLGAGNGHPALHNPDYDFPDSLIETGSNLFFEIINQYFHG